MLVFVVQRSSLRGPGVQEGILKRDRVASFPVGHSYSPYSENTREIGARVDTHVGKVIASVNVWARERGV